MLTHMHTCTHGRPLAHALHSALVPVCANAPSGPSAVLVSVCQAQPAESLPETLSHPHCCTTRHPLMSMHTQSASAFLVAAWCPIMQAHLALFTVPDRVSTAVSAACVLYLLLPVFSGKCIALWGCPCVHGSPRGRAHPPELGVKV